MSKILITKEIFSSTGKIEIISLEDFLNSLLITLNNDDTYAFNFRKRSLDEEDAEYERKMIKLSDGFNYNEYIKNNSNVFICSDTTSNYDIEKASSQMMDIFVIPTHFIDLGNFEYCLADKESFRKVRTIDEPYLYGLACLDSSPLRLKFTKSLEDLIKDNNKGY